ncbi:MAG: uL22 family ribosomal protein, partial [Candidatus Nanohaloarchaea archaeon]
DNTEKAENKLEKVIEKELAVPYTKYDSDVGHRSGGKKGRYPEKAAKEVLEVLQQAVSNAEHEGLHKNQLEIQKFITNQGRELETPGRHPGTTKAAHIKIIVGEKQ